MTRSSNAPDAICYRAAGSPKQSGPASSFTFCAGVLGLSRRKVKLDADWPEMICIANICVIAPLAPDACY
jgi:hypothetical protein